MDPFFGFRCLRDELRFLLQGDQIFLDNDGGGGGGSGGDDGGSGGGDRSGSDDDTPQEDNDDRSGSGGDDSRETLSAEQARKLRSENKTQRERAKKAEQELEELRKNDLGDKERAEQELEKSTKRVGELETRVSSLTVRAAAAEAGIPPERAKAAAALVDLDELDIDDEEAIVAALKGLKKEHGYLFAVETDDDGKGKKKPGDVDAGRRDRGEHESDVSPGTGRLRKAYAETKS